MGTETNKDDRNTPEYLAQLLKDKKQIQALPNVFIHTEKILDEEINRVRLTLFHQPGKRETMDLPEPIGPVVQLQEKLFVPVKEYPDFNFVGRILGPRGMTAKELEQFTGCKIMVRGKGSMRDKAKPGVIRYFQEDQNRGKANWEHLNEDLHVLITVEDTRNRGEVKIQKAKDEVKKLLVPAPDGEDELKKRQLMELAIMNGTYRDAKIIHPAQLAQAHLQLGGMPMFLPPAPGTLGARPPLMVPVSGAPGQSIHDGLYPQFLGGLPMMWSGNGSRHDFANEHARFLQAPQALQMRMTPAGTPIMLAPRLAGPPQHMVATSQHSMNGAPPPLVPPGQEQHSLMYNPYSLQGQVTSPMPATSMDPYGLSAAQPSIFEYQTQLDQTQAGAVQKMRRTLEGVRGHPYGRVSLS